MMTVACNNVTRFIKYKMIRTTPTTTTKGKKSKTFYKTNETEKEG